MTNDDHFDNAPLQAAAATCKVEESHQRDETSFPLKDQTFICISDEA